MWLFIIAKYWKLTFILWGLGLEWSSTSIFDKQASAGPLVLHFPDSNSGVPPNGYWYIYGPSSWCITRSHNMESKIWAIPSCDSYPAHTVRRVILHIHITGYTYCLSSLPPKSCFLQQRLLSFGLFPHIIMSLPLLGTRNNIPIQSGVYAISNLKANATHISMHEASTYQGELSCLAIQPF